MVSQCSLPVLLVVLQGASKVREEELGGGMAHDDRATTGVRGSSKHPVSQPSIQ